MEFRSVIWKRTKEWPDASCCACKPVKQKTAAWVIGQEAVTADALSTAFMVMSEKQIRMYGTAYPKVRVAVLSEGNKALSGQDLSLTWYWYATAAGIIIMLNTPWFHKLGKAWISEEADSFGIFNFFYAFLIFFLDFQKKLLIINIDFIKGRIGQWGE